MSDANLLRLLGELLDVLKLIRDKESKQGAAAKPTAEEPLVVKTSNKVADAEVLGKTLQIGKYFPKSDLKAQWLQPLFVNLDNLFKKYFKPAATEKSFFKSPTSVPEGLPTGNLSKIQQGAAVLKQVGIGLGAIGLGMIAFNYVQPESVAKALISLGGVFAFIVGLDRIKGQIRSGVGMMALVGLGLLPLVGALKLAESVTWKTVGIIATSVVGLGLAAAALGAPAVSPLVTLGAGMIALIGAALLPLVTALNIAQGVTWQSVGIIGSSLVTLGLAAATLGVPVVAGMVAIGAGVIAILGAALVVFSQSLKNISDLPDDLPQKGKYIGDFISNLSNGLGLGLFTLVLAVPALSYVGDYLVSFSNSLASISSLPNDLPEKGAAIGSFIRKLGENLGVFSGIKLLAVSPALRALTDDLLPFIRSFATLPATPAEISKIGTYIGDFFNNLSDALGLGIEALWTAGIVASLKGAMSFVADFAKVTKDLSIDPKIADKPKIIGQFFQNLASSLTGANITKIADYVNQILSGDIVRKLSEFTKSLNNVDFSQSAAAIANQFNTISSSVERFNNSLNTIQSFERIVNNIGTLNTAFASISISDAPVQKIDLVTNSVSKLNISLAGVSTQLLSITNTFKSVFSGANIGSITNSIKELTSPDILASLNIFVARFLETDISKLTARSLQLSQQFDAITSSINRLKTTFSSLDLSGGNLKLPKIDLEVGDLNINFDVLKDELTKTNDIISTQLTINRQQFLELQKQSYLLANIKTGGDILPLPSQQKQVIPLNIGTPNSRVMYESSPYFVSPPAK